MKITILSFTALLLVTAAAGSAAAAAAADGKCLYCHGDIRGLKPGHYVDAGRYRATSHALLGCTACHGDVGRGHPKDGVTPSKATCRECHGPIAEEYGRSAHASRAACADCHDPHAVRQPLEISGDQITRQCGKCHEEQKTAASHRRWLPQTELHLSAVPCIACHTASRDFAVTLYIEKKDEAAGGGFAPATRGDLEKMAGPQVKRLVDADGDGAISLAELREFNRRAPSEQLRLRGMMMPRTVTHSYQILDNRWDCSFCHASGPAAMRESSVAFPNADGTYESVQVEKGAVLDVLYGAPDFYMLGSTRNRMLDYAGLAILVGGMLMPVGHGTLRFLTRNNRKEH